MFSQALVVFAFASAAFATVFVTAPVASTIDAAGQSAVVQWQDSGSAPSLSDFGPAKISIYAGNAQQQTLLQTLNSSVDVSQVSSINFIPDPSIGPDSSEYFIRFESLSLKDATQPQFPALAFSAKFTLTGMTGAFSAAVLSQISGQSTAPLASQSSPAGASTPAAATTTPSLTTATSKKASSTGSTPSATKKASGAMVVRAGWAGAVLGAVVGITIV